jgi:hypothetical protein
MNLNSCVVSLVFWTPGVLAPLPKTVEKLGFTVTKMGNKKRFRITLCIVAHMDLINMKTLLGV